MIKYVSGGHFGDVIHSLYVIKKNYEEKNEKGELYLVQNLGEGLFTRPVELICNEIRSILTNQEYLSLVSHEYEKNLPYYNLSGWRNSNKLLKVCWTELLCDFYNFSLPEEKIRPWIKVSEKNPLFENKVVIHQSIVNFRKSDTFPWENIIKNNDCIFVGYGDLEYNNFEFKHLVDVHYMKDFSECCSILNTCKFYVGNLTSITAIAHSMGIPRLTELAGRDSEHYKDEFKYFDNFFYISEYHGNSELNGIQKFINL